MEVEREVNAEFAKGVNNKRVGNEYWCGSKKKLLDVASEVRGYTNGKPKYFERCL